MCTAVTLRFYLVSVLPNWGPILSRLSDREYYGASHSLKSKENIGRGSWERSQRDWVTHSQARQMAFLCVCWGVVWAEGALKGKGKHLLESLVLNLNKAMPLFPFHKARADGESCEARAKAREQGLIFGWHLTEDISWSFLLACGVAMVSAPLSTYASVPNSYGPLCCAENWITHLDFMT